MHKRITNGFNDILTYNFITGCRGNVYAITAEVFPAETSYNYIIYKHCRCKIFDYYSKKLSSRSFVARDKEDFMNFINSQIFSLSLGEGDYYA